MSEIPIPKVRLPEGAVARLPAIGLVGMALFGALFLYVAFTTYIPPNELAVRQVYVGPGKGMHEELYGPGLYFVMPGYERLHRFPRDMWLLEFNDSKISASETATVQPAIRIQTSEGYQVTVDVAIAYRVVDPYKTIRAVGPGQLYESALMIPRSDKVLRQKLGQLNAEDFYSGDLRRRKAEEARTLLAEELESAGIQIWSVMVRHYNYDQRYQDAIEQRKIQDQTVFKNRAEAVSAVREAEKNRVLAEGQAIVDVEKQRGEGEVQKIDADADLYYRQKVAEGNLMVALAEAEGTRLENAALQAAGASNLVGLEMAKALQGAKVIVVPTDGASGKNPLNLDSMLTGW
jgi:regulator of protease activity HflC (stomatin/prohibitin superfamily)